MNHPWRGRVQGRVAIKRGLQVAEGLPSRRAYRYEQAITHDLSKTDENREMRTAFVEKRKVDYTDGR